MAQQSQFLSALELNPAEREFQNQQRQQSLDFQEREVQQQLQEREKALQNKPPEIPAIGTELSPGKSIYVEKISINVGDAKVDSPVAIFKRYQGRDLNSTDLLNLLREVNDFYAAQGYVTSVATIPPQDLGSGTLVIQMLWGRVEGFLINGKPPQGWYERAMLLGGMPGIEGSIFNIHMSDQLVENLSTAGKTVQVEVVPADRHDYSSLNLKVKKQLPVTGSLSVDNSGSERADGNTRSSAQISVSDLLGLNDTLSLNTSKRFFSERKDDNSERVGGISWQMPIGPWSISASYSKIQSEQLASTSIGGDYHNQSSIEDAKVKLNRVLARSQFGKTNAWFEISNRDNATYFEGKLIKTGSRKYSQFTLGLSHSMVVAGGGAYADISWTKGVPWFNGYTLTAPEGGSPLEADFNLFSSNLSWQRPDRLFGIPLVYELRAGMQYSQNSLLGKNKQYIGDEYTVRGYKDMPLSGDSGAYLSTTLSAPIQIGGLIRSISPLIGLDYGWAKNNLPGRHTMFISGMALGLKIDANKAQGALIFGLPIKSELSRDFGSVFYASLSYRF